MKLQPPAEGGDLTIYLSTNDAGDGNGSDFALWENARLITPGRGELPLRDVRSVLQQMARQRDAVSGVHENEWILAKVKIRWSMLQV